MKICDICGKKFKPHAIAEVRDAWLQAGGFGTVPESAKVHPGCNAKEQRQLKNGSIKLKDLYVKKTEA